MTCVGAVTPDGLSNVQAHNAELSKSCALQGKLAGFLLRAQQRCHWHTCAVRAHQQDRHMVEINHLFFMSGGCSKHATVEAVALNDWSAAAGHFRA